jgi:hypothetical protein
MTLFRSIWVPHVVNRQQVGGPEVVWIRIESAGSVIELAAVEVSCPPSKAFLATDAWNMVESQLVAVIGGFRGAAIALAGSAGDGTECFVESLFLEAAGRGVPSLRIGLVPGQPIAGALGEPVREFFSALHEKRPGLPVLATACGFADEFVEMWMPVVWPTRKPLPARLHSDLLGDTRELARALVAVLEATSTSIVIGLSDWGATTPDSQDILGAFAERRGTSASLVVIPVLPGTDLGSSFTVQTIGPVTARDVSACLGDVTLEVASRVVAICDRQRFLLHEFAGRRDELKSRPLAELSTVEAEDELAEFWSYVCRLRFEPLVQRLDGSDRRILLAIASSGDGSLSAEQLIRSIGDTNRFDQSSSILPDRIVGLVNDGFLAEDARGGLHGMKPGLATYLRRN